MVFDDRVLVELRGEGARVGFVFSQSHGAVIMTAMNDTTH